MNNVLKQSTSSFIRGTKELQTYRTVNGKKVKHILFKGTPGIPCRQEGFHCFRRFRETQLDLTPLPPGIRRFWMGHDCPDMTAIYTQMQGRVTESREWAEKVPLGFKLPKNQVLPAQVQESGSPG